MRGPGPKPVLLVRLVIPATAVFVVTILALIAIVFSDQRSPVARFLDRHGNTLLLWEFIAVVLLTGVSLYFDRRTAVTNTAIAPEPSDTGPAVDSVTRHSHLRGNDDGGISGGS